MDAISEHLEAVSKGQITRLLINIPPGTMKSMSVSVFWPAWEWGPRGMSHTRIIGASHEEGLATRDNMKMRHLVQSEWYQKLWPMTLADDQNQKTYFQTEKTGWRQSCPVRSMTGKRGDRVIWDDPHSVEDAHSVAQLETANRIFRETLPTRLNNPDSSAIIIVMQRLNEKDISGEIIKNGHGYEHLCLPMEYEGPRKATSIGFIDPRKEIGDLLFPARFPRDVVDRDKKIMGSHAVAGQFQQRPSPLGGGIIRGAWFGRYTVLPKIKYRKIFADTAQKVKQHNDFSVFQCWGKGEDGKLYFLDQLRGKWEAPDLRRNAVDFWNKHKADLSSPLRQFMVEDKSSGTGLIQEIKHKEGIPVFGIEREKDKLTRVMDVVGYIESGHVMLPEGMPWMSDFIAECEAFTANDSHVHDDQIDPMCDAINDAFIGPGPLRISAEALAQAARRR